MKGSFFTKCLVLLLTLTLVVGPGVFVPAMAASASDCSSTMMQDMCGMNMSGAHETNKGCCPSSDKNQDTKGSLCASACAAVSQAALPSSQPAFVRQAVTLLYVCIDTSLPSRSLLPDYPPPKA